ncbi:hypothetical protein A0H81_02921 [Grifola frondosa]|uniref:Uncharacterized protein n=1 Tax=Grifola frondosa TaxID=5627 RepID=A0A1C7MJ31_GRIFR|nr:hypothetical protein A0H81_02921 [Grifola frondosa]
MSNDGVARSPQSSYLLGAQSWVRQQCGISLNGTGVGLSYGVIDFTPSTNFPSPRAKSIIESPISGALGYIPRPNGTARVYALLKDASLVNTLDTTSLEDMTEHITDASDARRRYIPG